MNGSFQERLKIPARWDPPADWIRIRTLDAHTAGEPLRIILDGLPDLKGNTVLERRRYMKTRLDFYRTALLWEPRGHADQYGCVIMPPVSPESDFSILFLHNEGYSTMCGHAVIAVTRVVLETGLIPMQTPETVLHIDSPAGLITAFARIEDRRIRSIRFHNVPSFVLARDETVSVPGLGNIRYDIAFGGAFYAFVRAEDAGVSMTPDAFRDLIGKGMAIKRAVMAAGPVTHPVEPDLSFLYGTIFYGPASGAGAHSRNVCIFAEGEVDRSPTGTGVSARMALHYFRGELEKGAAMIIESILGTRFTGRVHAVTRFGSHEAVIPEVEGNAHITGRAEHFIDPEDPLRHGFILR